MADDPLDARLPPELDYAPCDRRTTNHTKLQIMLRIGDSIEVEGAAETKWRTALSAKLLAEIARLQGKMTSFS